VRIEPNGGQRCGEWRVVCLFFVAGSTSAQRNGTEQNPLQAAAFMAGCWRGAAGNGRTIEEYYTVPSGNLVQGMTRYLARRPDTQEMNTIDYEFTLIEVNGPATRLHPHPKGQPSDTFSEKERASGRLVWENLAHDFPQRIMYNAAPGDSLIARIEGGNRAMEWRMGRVACPGVR
jgi:hypothetical protein